METLKNVMFLVSVIAVIWFMALVGVSYGY